MSVTLLEQSLSILIFIIPLALLVAAMGFLWMWGGIKANALGYLTVGIFFLISGALFIYVDMINVYARMDDAYYGNVFGGVYLFIVGGLLLFASLVGYGVRWWLALIGVVGVALLFDVFSRQVLSANVLLYAMGFVTIMLVIILVLRQVVGVVVGLLAASIGVLILWVAYGAGAIAFVPVDSGGCGEQISAAST